MRIAQTPKVLFTARAFLVIQATVWPVQVGDTDRKTCHCASLES